MSLNISISVKNPNKADITYQESSAALRYKDHDIGNVPIPAGKIGATDTKQLNLTLTIFGDRLLTDVSVYGDAISGSFPVSTYTKIKGKIRLKFKITISNSLTLSQHQASSYWRIDCLVEPKSIFQLALKPMKI
ncbi:uncharacterized protein [Rutidosis leptorrhynchoides]|uniref:uncharacterized protein n=1 Tax=Rutidosis leptorrhynchoides TaxID=125765 RepID=UPI003A998C37